MWYYCVIGINLQKRGIIMERVCPKCGTLVTNDGVFCPECGTKLESAVDLNKPQSEPVSIPVQPTPVNIPQASVPMQNTYQQPVYQNPAPQYQQNFNNAPVPERYEHMSVGSWVGTVILTTWFGLISLILLFVWGFGSSTPQPKKNYCRAMLIFELIAFILVIVWFVVFMCFIGWNFDNIVKWFTDLGEGFERAFR